MDHTSSAIFQRNYLSRIIRYDTQAAYGGTAPRTELIQAANRMSRRIDHRLEQGRCRINREGRKCLNLKDH